jgi:hypothetical protein
MAPRPQQAFSAVARRPLRATTALVAVAATIAGCTALPPTRPRAAAPAHTAAPRPAALHGEAARAGAAVDALRRALQAGDVARLCRPEGVFTSAVVTELNALGPGCETTVETSSAFTTPPAMTVTAVAVRPDVANATVSVDGRSVPLDIVRHGRRWLVSFSDGDDPVAALQP